MNRKITHLKMAAALSLATLGLGMASQAAAQTPVFVKTTGNPSKGVLDGSSWDQALVGYAGLKTALATPSAVVYVAAGTYNVPEDQSLVLQSEGTFYIKGGYPSNVTGTDTSSYQPASNLTVLDGASATRRAFNEEGGDQVLHEQNIYISGMQFNNFTYDEGAVFRFTYGTRDVVNIFTDCSFQNNSSNHGAAMELTTVTGENTIFQFKNCFFSNNKSTGSGGALYFTTVYNNTDEINTGNLRIDGCSFVANHSDHNGGAITFTTAHGWTITNSSFCSNTSGDGSYNGGAIFMTTARAHVISNTKFLNNSSNRKGGAIYGTTAGASITGSLFSGNTVARVETDEAADVYVTTASPKDDSYTIASSYLQDPLSSNYTDNDITLGGGNHFNDYSTTTIPSGCPVQIDDQPLAIKYAQSLKATLNGATVHLTWASATETNNKGFEVQRSADGINYSSIGYITSRATDGNSAQAISYQFTDSHPAAGENIYRLKQIDGSGKATFSNISTVSVNATSSFKVYPSPATSKIHLNVSSDGQYQIVDFTGKVVAKGQTKAGLNTISISSFAAGIYIIKATDSKTGKAQSSKFIVK